MRPTNAHRRPYRIDVFTEAEAVAFLEAGAGHRFDPAVVERFLTVPRSERLIS